MARVPISRKSARSPAKKIQNTKAPGKSTGKLQVRPVRNPRMTVPTAWQPNPSGKLKVSRTPVGSGTYNPQLGQPPLQASWNPNPRGK